MTLTILDVEQRSPEWYAARCGIVTASVVGKLIGEGAPDALDVLCSDCKASPGKPCVSMSKKTATPIKTLHSGRKFTASMLPDVLKVADNDTSRGVIASLVAERITQQVDETFMNDDMMRGVLHEPYARDIYSGFHQQAVECGFMLRQEDGWTLGASPDGLVADDGGCEIKCPRAKSHIRTILADEVPSFYVPQIQASLLVSGRKWWDYVSFCAGEPLYVKRVYPDQRWFDAITAACVAFEQNATAQVAEYGERIKGLPKTERIDLEIQVA